MTVRVRLLLMLVAMTVVLAGPAIYSFLQLQSVRDIAFEMRGRHAAAWAAAGELHTSLAEADRLQRSYLIVQDSASRASLQAAFTEAHEAYGALTEIGYAWSAISLGADLRALEEASREIDRLVRAGELTRATQYFRFGSGTVGTSPSGLADPTLLSHWWRFLLASMATYGLLPRVVAASITAWRLRAAIEWTIEHTPTANDALDRMNAPAVQTR